VAEATRTRRWAWALLRVGVTAAAVAWILHRVDPGRALAQLAAAPWWAFAAPFALMLVNGVIQARRYQLLLSAGGVSLPLRLLLRVILQAIFVSQVLPRGGADVLRLAWLRAATGRIDAVLAALMVARLGEVTVMMTLLVYALSWGVADRWPWLGLSAAIFALVFIGFSVSVLWTARFGPSALRRLPIAALRRNAAAFARALQGIGRDRGALARAMAWTVPMALGNVLSAWLVLRAYGLALPPGDALALVPAMDSVILLPVTVNGVGLREGVFVHVLTGFGVLESTAVAMALTRWCAELGRAAVGGVWFLVGGTLPVRGRAEDPSSGPGGVR